MLRKPKEPRTQSQELMQVTSSFLWLIVSLERNHEACIGGSRYILKEAEPQ